ncbi:MAG TPA: amino acid ABC transporter permease [Marmoricola sp.]
MRKSTRRRLTQGVLYLLLVGAGLVLALIADWEAINENFFDIDILRTLWPEIITVGAKNTVVYTAIAFGGGLALALVLALMKMSPVGPYRWLATLYIEFFRGLPALIVIVFFGLGIPLAFQWQPPGGFAGAGVLALIVVSAAYMAETLRAGIQAVPKGQTEAARSLGMSGAWTMVSVILPQAFRVVIPPLTNEFVLLIKDTALLSVVGAQASERELTTYARDMMSGAANPTPLIAAAVMYLIITLPLTRLVAWMEKRQQRAR